MIPQRGTFQNSRFQSTTNKGSGGREPICKYFLQGTCRKGNACLFSHNVSQSQDNQYQYSVGNDGNARNNFRVSNQVDVGGGRGHSHGGSHNEVNQRQICKYFLNGTCQKGDFCNFSHQVPFEHESQKRQNNQFGRQAQLPDPNFFSARGRVPEKIFPRSSQSSNFIESAARNNFANPYPNFDQFKQGPYRTSAQSGFGQMRQKTELPKTGIVISANMFDSLGDGTNNSLGSGPIYQSESFSNDVEMMNEGNQPIEGKSLIVSDVFESNRNEESQNRTSSYENFTFGNIPEIPPPELVSR